MVFAADGAGNFQAMSSALRKAAADEACPLEVVTFDWSHGYGRIFADQTDRSHMIEEGKKLAALVMAHRTNCPDSEIYLVGHSAGCGAVLVAAESLPPGTLDRIMLLSPSVCSDYDLRPMLRSTRKTVEVFYSKNDRFFLGLGTSILGTVEGRRDCDAAGRVGFHPTICSREDAVLYYRLRQHPWHPATDWTGNFGGHYGTYKQGYLRSYILPLMLDPS